MAGYAIIKEPEKSLEKLNQLWEWYRTAPDFVDKLLSLLQNLKKWCLGSERRQGESMQMGVSDRICAGF